MKLRCPICHTEITWEGNQWRPFCSERCKMVDLGEWAAEGYRIKGESTSPRPDDEAGQKEEESTDGGEPEK